MIYIYLYIYNGICIEKQIILSVGNSIYVLDGLNILFILVLVLVYIIGKLLILNRVILNMIFISLLISILSYDILNFIIYYEFILIPISILVISSGSYCKKEGIIWLLYYTIIGSLFIILLLSDILILNNITCNYFYIYK